MESTNLSYCFRVLKSVAPRIKRPAAILTFDIKISASALQSGAEPGRWEDVRCLVSVPTDIAAGLPARLAD